MILRQRVILRQRADFDTNASGFKPYELLCHCNGAPSRWPGGETSSSGAADLGLILAFLVRFFSLVKVVT